MAFTGKTCVLLADLALAACPGRRRAALSAGCMLLACLSGCSGCQSDFANSEPPAEQSETASEGGEDERPAAEENSSRQPSAESSTSRPEGQKQSSEPRDRAAHGSNDGHEGQQRSQRQKPSAADAAEALSKAKALQKQARRKSESGDHGAAFLDARQAWDLVRRFPDHEGCRDLKETLAAELETLAEQANRSSTARSGPSGKTLIEQ